jgi:hypothetical protein
LVLGLVGVNPMTSIADSILGSHLLPCIAAQLVVYSRCTDCDIDDCALAGCCDGPG